MEKVSTQNRKLMPLFIVSFLMLAGSLYCTDAKASTSSTPLTGQHLAYYVGYHYAPGYYKAPGYYYHKSRKLYWTGWRHAGPNCRKNCLVDRRDGRVIRCKRTCRY